MKQTLTGILIVLLAAPLAWLHAAESTAAYNNVLLLMSDEHNPRILGCYGDTLVKTPTLDALGLRDKTIILYTADHGEMLGDRGIWYKNSFYATGEEYLYDMQADPGEENNLIRDPAYRKAADDLKPRASVGWINTPAKNRTKRTLLDIH